MQADKSSDLRKKADSAAESWRTDQAAAAETANDYHEARLAADQAYAYRMPREVHVKVLAKQIRMAEAANAAKASGWTHGLICDEADLADGNEFAIACDRDRLLDNLQTCAAEQERLQKELDESKRRGWELVNVALDAFKKWHQQRLAKQFPPPISFGAGNACTLRDWITALAQPPEPPTPGNTNQIRLWKDEETELLAALELELLDREKEEKEEALRLQGQREQEEQRARLNAEENQRAAAERQAERDRVEKLAEAHRARTAEEGGAS